MISVVDNASENSCALEILTALTSIGPEAHDMLYYTVLKLAGRLSMWARRNEKAIGIIWQVLGTAIKVKKSCYIVVVCWWCCCCRCLLFVWCCLLFAVCCLVLVFSGV